MDTINDEDKKVKRKSIVNNIDPYKNPITFTTGVILMIVGLVIILFPLIPYFFTLKMEIPEEPIIPVTVGYIIGGVGFISIISPEKVVKFLTRKGENL